MTEKQAKTTIENVEMFETKINQILQVNTKTVKSNKDGIESAKLFKYFGGVLIVFIFLVWIRAYYWDYQFLIDMGLVSGGKSKLYQ